MPRMGTALCSASRVLSIPPCEMNNFTFRCARISFCGSQLAIITFDGTWRVASNFHRIFWRSDANTLVMAVMSCFSKLDELTMVPSEKKMAPSVAESRNFWIFYAKEIKKGFRYIELCWLEMGKYSHTAGSGLIERSICRPPTSITLGKYALGWLALKWELSRTSDTLDIISS